LLLKLVTITWQAFIPDARVASPTWIKRIP
jgi:hypothetical protein